MHHLTQDEYNRICRYWFRTGFQKCAVMVGSAAVVIGLVVWGFWG